MPIKPKNKHIVGIIGGMGPEATVELQRLIVKYTPAKCDQDHIEVIAHNNPSIPDRTKSLAEDDGRSYSAAVIASGNTLIKAGATILCMPCITAHARFEYIQAALSRKLINLVDLVAEKILTDKYKQPVAILSTEGSKREGVIARSFLKSQITFVLPNDDCQIKVSETIGNIKAGRKGIAEKTLEQIIKDLKQQGIITLLLGCTELAMLEDSLRISQIKVFNPLKILARNVVEQCHSSYMKNQVKFGL